MCNLASLPLSDQQKVLAYSSNDDKNVHVVEVNKIATDTGGKEEPEKEREVILCEICNVFKNKCV